MACALIYSICHGFSIHVRCRKIVLHEEAVESEHMPLISGMCSVFQPWRYYCNVKAVEKERCEKAQKHTCCRLSLSGSASSFDRSPAFCSYATMSTEPGAGDGIVAGSAHNSPQ